MIESVQNPSVKRWKKLLTKKEREKTGQYIVEGFHLVEEALKANVVINVIISEGVEIPSWVKDSNVGFEAVTKKVAKEISDTENSQGIFAVCQQSTDKVDLTAVKSIVMLDAIQDPGNVGTIIRTADAAGVDLVVLGAGCVDVFNQKAIRSSQGSIFHLPVIKGDLAEMIAELKTNDFAVIGTSLQDATDYAECEVPEKVAVIVGNEGAGVESEILKLADKNVFIPIRGKAESLNVGVATGILLYHFVK